MPKPVSTPKPHRAPRILVDGHFVVKEFENPSGGVAYRVDGRRRDKTRVRENFDEEIKARARQIELETEWLKGEARTEIQATKLTREQISLAEAAFIRLGPGNDNELTLAVENWVNHGRQQQAAGESPRLDDAVTQFQTWLKQTDEIRQRTKDKYRVRIDVFKNSVPNIRIADFSTDMVHKYLSNRTGVSTLTKIGDRQAIHRFFEWCMDRPRRWTKSNPCREIKIRHSGDQEPPAILTLDECKKLLTAAKTYRRGLMVPYVVVCLFGGLRPAEAARLTWDAVNLDDSEIRVESQSSKTKRSRVISICPTLNAWLRAYKNKPFKPSNLRRGMDTLKRAAGYIGRIEGDNPDKLKPWEPDIMRHTAISHYFRKTGSYGQTAEQFGNSEAIIKKHYQGRVSTEDTKAFYSLLPKKARRK